MFADFQRHTADQPLSRPPAALQVASIHPRSGRSRTGGRTAAGAAARPGRRSSRAVGFAARAGELLLAGLLVLRPGTAGGQGTPTIGTIGEFAATGETYGPPHEQQPRWRLSGREAELLEGGRYRLRQLELEFFRPDGDREVWLRAPECVHDAARGCASSSGPLSIRSGDGRAAIEGEGFLWEQATATLIISNAVRATLLRTATNPPPAPLVITSRWFVLEITNRRAVFHEQVRGEDDEILFTCGQLTVESAGTNAMFDAVEAQQGLLVVAKTTGRRITANRAAYTRAAEQVELSGAVSWTQADQSGRAERLLWDRRSGSALARGQVSLQLPAGSFGWTATPTGGSNSAQVELRADAIFTHTNFVRAEGHVRVRTETDQLDCNTLTAYTDDSRQRVESALCEGDVRVQQRGGTLRAARAEYLRPTGRVVFTGQPEWSDARAQGRAARLTIESATGRLLAEDDVSVTLALSGQTVSLGALFPEQAAATNGEPQQIRVTAQRLESEPGRTLFEGNVRAHQLPVTGEEPRVRSDALELQFAARSAASETSSAARLETITARGRVFCERGRAGVTNGAAMHRRLSARTLSARADPATGALTTLIAEGDVVMDQPAGRARGGRAVYEAATGVLELSESPELETPQVHVTGAHALVWDRAHDRYAMRGPFKARIRAGAVRPLIENLPSP